MKNLATDFTDFHEFLRRFKVKYVQNLFYTEGSSFGNSIGCEGSKLSFFLKIRPVCLQSQRGLRYVTSVDSNLRAKLTLNEFAKKIYILSSEFHKKMTRKHEKFQENN